MQRRSERIPIRQCPVASGADLFACVRPCKYYEGTKSNYPNVNLVIFRENTEDLYAGIEFDINTKEARQLIAEINSLQPRQIRDDSAISIKPISVTCSRRIVKYAFDYAVKHNRKKVTAVHKANIMKFSDGLFLRTAREVAQEYAGKVEFQDVIVDNMCITGAKAEFMMCWSCRTSRRYCLIFARDWSADWARPGIISARGSRCLNRAHGSAPKYAGKNKVNLTATILRLC